MALSKSAYQCSFHQPEAVTESTCKQCKSSPRTHADRKLRECLLVRRGIIFADVQCFVE